MSASESPTFQTYCGPIIVNGVPVDGCPRWDGSCRREEVDRASVAESR